MIAVNLYLTNLYKINSVGTYQAIGINYELLYNKAGLKNELMIKKHGI